MTDQFIVLDLITPNGAKIPNAHVLRLTPDLYKSRRAARAIELKKGEEYHYPEPEIGADGQYTIDPEQNTLGLFLAEERVEMQNLARYLTSGNKNSTPVIDLPKGTQIPIICCPDGGIITAEGFAQGMEWYSEYKPVLYSASKKYGKKDAISNKAVEQIAKSGIMVIADSVIDKGNTIKRVLKSFFEKHAALGIEPPITSPIKVIVVSNVSYLSQEHHSHFNPEVASNGGGSFILEATKKFAGFEKLKKDIPIDLHFYTSDVEIKEMDIQERGSIISHGVHPAIGENNLGRLDKRRRMKEKPHHFLDQAAIELNQATQRNTP